MELLLWSKFSADAEKREVKKISGEGGGGLKLLIEVCAKTFIEISVEKISKKGVSAFKLIYTIITDFVGFLFVFLLRIQFVE